MGIFVSPDSNIYKGLSNNQTTILTADAHVIEVTSINVTNTTPAPIRFNLLKVRTQGVTVRTCYASTTANLPNIIYDNGLSGIGATITNNSSTLTAFTIDGITPTINSRILVKNQTSTFQNGIYVLTTVGSSSIPWVLTRASDYNKPAQINKGDLIVIQAGTLNSGITFVQTEIITAIGTSPILFAVNTSSTSIIMNEFEIAPYANINVLQTTGLLRLQYNLTPYMSDKLVCFSNGYTQLFDCNIVYLELNETPLN
jgi:hypothetical protein